MRLPLALGTLCLAAPSLLGAQSPAPADSFAWLADAHGAKPMEWVLAQNKLTLDTLRALPVYDTLYRRILAVITTPDRIAYPTPMSGHVYNFWTDSAHPRGIWRRTTPVSYITATPAWETIIDVDALSAAEHVTWAWAGADCRPPEFVDCLVNLSRGGADATEVREFDLNTRRFVADGFHLAEAKSSVAWVDASTVLVATDFGAGSMTTSGYARIVKRWRRGTPLASAVTIFESPASDMGTFATSRWERDRILPIVYHAPTFFDHEVFIVIRDSLIKLDVPKDADPNFAAGQLVVYLRKPWTAGGREFATGSVIAIDLAAFLGGKRDFQVIVAQTSRITVDAVSTTKNDVLVSLLDNVRNELHRYRLVNGRWEDARIPAPALGTVSVAATDAMTDDYFFDFEGFLQPTSLYHVTESGELQLVKQRKPMFDAKGLEVSQRWATSADGTKVPYFLVRRADAPRDGTTPTILTAYGGFQVSELPYYSATRGAAWLERGGAEAVANIRGGGEFGPEWHRAAQKANRQRAYDDFTAVARDLIAAKLTSPSHLGIEGGSNGGLLVGVAFTQHPELYGAVSCQVPLLDMRGYTKLQAGASWIDEYGDPDQPDQWAYLSKYSPYQNVAADRRYPPVLFTTTTSDDRVGPEQARKMAAKMEAMGHKVLFFENVEGGHGAGDTPEQQATYRTVGYAFLWGQLK